MSNSFSNVASKGLLDYLFGKTSIFDTQPAIWVALFTTDPTDPGVSDAGSVEATGNAYIRIEAPDTDWNTATSADPSVLDNVNPITFPEATGSWGGEINSFGLYTLVTGGTYLGGGTLGDPKTPTNGDTPRFAAGALDVTLT